MLLALCSGLGLSACSNYALGPGGSRSFRTLYVAPVENNSDAAQAAALTSSLLRDAFVRDGRVALVDSPEEAEATLQLVLTQYGREVATVRPGDTGLARKFALTLDGTVTLVDRSTGRTLLNARPVQAVRDAFTDSGQQQAEYETLSLLADELARQVSHATLDEW